MAKKQDAAKAIYEPGELNRVRGKLGDIDEMEAKRMAQILGGEVGMEKSVPIQPSKIRRQTVETGSSGRRGKRPMRTVETASDEEAAQSIRQEPEKNDPADDPLILLQTSYFERIKMDRYAAQFEFEIKSSFQVFVSIITLMGEPIDYVNHRFVSRRMNVYYKKIAQLVASTRNLFPRNNARRSERMKKASPYAYTILDTIRQWNIERIDADLGKLQARPRSVKVSEFADILKAIYKPLFLLDKLHMDTHIKGAYKLLYKIICIENSTEPRERIQDTIRAALSSFADVRRNVHYGLYPLLMKFISDRWFPYERLFLDRRRRYKAFLGVTDGDQIKPVELSPDQAENGNLEELQAEADGERDAEDAADSEETSETAEQKARDAAEDAEMKALEHSLKVLETLFPQAGWDNLAEYPDLYPYFVNVYGLRRGYELIAPTDPLQQAAILMHIMEDLCTALRYVSFGMVTGPDGNQASVGEVIGKTITNWRQFIDDGFSKEYLPRLTEYCRILEHSSESRTTPYAKRTLNELRWIKRLYFLPYYKFESLGPPPFQKQDIVPIYSETRNLRKYLTMVAAGIEQGNRTGGAEANVICDGIENPWKTYNFEIPNPASKRMDALLGQGRRNNAALIFFSLSVAPVLDYLLNSESSWAYSDRPGAVFRSINGDGTVPLFGIENKLDADKIFKDSMKKKE
jgi:hypothetical protein